MEVKHSTSEPTSDGPEQFFSGKVRVAPLFTGGDPSRMSCACVTFDPSARSAWHTHPCGQTLIVTSGRGFVQAWGGPIREIRRATSSGPHRARSIGMVQTRMAA